MEMVWLGLVTSSHQHKIRLLLHDCFGFALSCWASEVTGRQSFPTKFTLSMSEKLARSFMYWFLEDTCRIVSRLKRFFLGVVGGFKQKAKGWILHAAA